MENQKGSSFGFIIVAIILAIALWRQFDTATVTFKKPALAIVYAIALAGAVYFIIRNYRTTSKQ